MDWGSASPPRCADLLRPHVVRAAQAAQLEFMAQLWRDSVGFMGAVMIRRIVGIAHVAEMKTIADPDVRYWSGTWKGCVEGGN